MKCLAFKVSHYPSWENSFAHDATESHHVFVDGSDTAWDATLNQTNVGDLQLDNATQGLY